MVSVTLLLAEARAAGLDVRGEGERLVICGPRTAEAIAGSLLRHKQEVLAALAADAPEVAWRVASMRAQRPATGPIPFLVARQAPHSASGCLSCGAPLAPESPGERLRCVPCVRAAWLVTVEPQT